jgi:UDP-N-acetylglucosamine 2-epimerase (non-hydrolysing)
MPSRRRVVTIVGTRPEAIKMAPVIRSLADRSAELESFVVATAQHREMLDQALATFGIKPDIDLGLMQPAQGLGDFAARALASVSAMLAELRPDAVLIQGDTTTVMVAALAAFYQRIRVGHVEAGLRSFDRGNPFPEEVDRRLTTTLADVHFAPTAHARANLLREGVPAEDVLVTGNTIVDALMSMPLDDDFEDESLSRVDFERRRVLLVTAHRRENHGAPLRSICQALTTLTGTFEDVEVVYPVHLNPSVAAVVREELENAEKIHLTPPVSYPDLLRLMRRCHFVLTDSGGIQEEAASFAKPVLVLRSVTERPELVDAGGARIVGTDASTIVAAATALLSDDAAYSAMRVARNPFGDGRAAERIVTALVRRFQEWS